MEYPRRINTHIYESKSLDIVSRSLPPEWIVRELTERDYGIDLYVELVTKDGLVTGDMIALQVKSTTTCRFNSKNKFSLSGIKRSTLNYWQGLPVPVFVFLVDLNSENVYWCCVQEELRKGSFNGDSATITLGFYKHNTLSNDGIDILKIYYLREKRWPMIESAMEKCLISYNTLGPLVLMCKRRKNHEVCSTTIQYLLLEHYENYVLLARYLLFKSPRALPEWYERNIEIHKENSTELTLNFTYQLAKEMLDEFVGKYRRCILHSYELVTNHQSQYFSQKRPYLHAHLCNAPHTFVAEDWYARYYFDEYENETLNPEKAFFEDFTEFDSFLGDLGRT
ncbi:DUF4365 domain-containing protein [Vibrio antiquarius]